MVSTRSSESKTDFEVVLNNELGQFGKFQIINLLFLFVPAAISAFMAGEYIFSASKLPHRCAIPECDGPNPEYSPDWISFAIPSTSSGFEDCKRYGNVTDQENVENNEICPVNLFNKSVVIACETFVYERKNSVVYDFNLECNEWLRALSGTLNSMGAMIALPLAGFISDHFGRRASVIFFSFNVALVGVVRSFSVNYTMYAALQFMHTAIGGGAFSAAYILATELVGPKYRVMTSATMSSVFALGQVLLGVIALLVHEWRHLSLVLFTPIFLLVSYRWLITESPRWLLSKGKKERAKNTLERAARQNGKIISESAMEYLLNAIPNQIEAAKNTKQTNENLFFRVIKSPVMLRRCCTTPILWITTTFIYYGLSINSVSLSGNMYLNYIATAAIEIPGFWTAVLVLDKIGRRTTLFLGYMLCGLCCLGFAFTPNNMTGLSLFLFLTGKYFIGLVMTSVYLYTAELYPTRHRHSFLGFSSMLGRIGSVISPLTPPLMVYWSGIPSTMFGGMAVISGLLVLTQPETRGLKVPDTFEEAERLGK
ncbi:organic cation transporter protein-like [Ostrinia furnacalis]|uniref:organic cation transporter protein-like n=1 Tax=Ostrinia furnacalis TaxID=93504 RepID=UPI0010407F94|nr:organic cation transporter protein-like [Ostrinia furnacalis]